MKYLVTLALFACMVAFTGCGEKRVEPSRLPQNTPEATIDKMVRALEAGDKAAFIACWEVDPEQRAYLEATFDVVLVHRELKREAAGKFGAEAWGSAWKKTGMRDESRDPFAGWDADKTKVTIDGDRAVASVEGRAEAVGLLMTDGVWKIYDENMTGGEDIILATRVLNTLKNAYDAGLAAVDKAKGPEDVHDAMTKSMQERADALKKQIDAAE